MRRLLFLFRCHIDGKEEALAFHIVLLSHFVNVDVEECRVTAGDLIQLIVIQLFHMVGSSLHVLFNLWVIIYCSVETVILDDHTATTVPELFSCDLIYVKYWIFF